MCTDKKKAVLGDFRAKMGEYLRLRWNRNRRDGRERKKASYPSRTACHSIKNCYFVNYRLATAHHGFCSAKLLNFLFTLIISKLMS